MLAEIAHLSLILALCVAFVLATVPLYGAYRHDQRMMQSAKPLTLIMVLLIIIAYALVTFAFMSDDFTLKIVAHHSNVSLPMIYKISAVWGGHEGSLLLWILVLSLWMGAVTLFSRDLPADISARVLAVLAMIAIGFMLFSLITSNPFSRTFPAVPVNGDDLNPLLQDFGMAIHPPMLYFGYVGFSVAFAFAIAALLSGEVDAAWVRWTRPWTTAAWGFLTLGIALGSWWAYYELGWGGWWFWDPVENASFMPWLVGTALMHSLAVTEKRDLFKSWTLLLAIFAFSLSLLGTFLVRSGVLTSVHAFASDPGRGLFILAFLSIVVGGSLTLFAFRAPTATHHTGFSFFSREMFLVFNNLLLVIAALTILMGTLFPLIADFMNLGKYSVGPPYFNTLFVPLMLILIFVLGIGPALRWKKTRKELWQPLVFMILPVATMLSVVMVLLVSHEYSIPTVISSAFVGWLLTSIIWDIGTKVRHSKSLWVGLKKPGLSYYAMQLAHLGLLVTAIGIAVVSYQDDKRDVRVEIGESIHMQGYRFDMEGVKSVEGENYIADQALVKLYQNNQFLMNLHPEKRYYASQPNNAMTEAAIDGRLHRDLFVALGEPLSNESWSMRIQYKPFLRFIWLGALMMVAAAFLAIFDKRYRKSYG